MNKNELLKRRAALQAENDTLLTALNAGSLTAEQITRSEAVAAELETIKSDMAALEAAEARIRQNATRQPAQAHDNAGDKPWSHPGEFFAAVYRHAQTHQADPRLLAASGGNESVDSEGGFLVSPEYSNTLFELAHNEGILAPRCNNLPLSGNSISIPAVDESSRVAGSRY